MLDLQFCSRELEKPEAPSSTPAPRPVSPPGVGPVLLDQFRGGFVHFAQAQYFIIRDVFLSLKPSITDLSAEAEEVAAVPAAWSNILRRGDVIWINEKMASPYDPNFKRFSRTAKMFQQRGDSTIRAFVLSQQGVKALESAPTSIGSEQERTAWANTLRP